MESLTLYVSPDGAPGAPGTTEAPMATIVAAQNAVRRRLAEGFAGDVAVLLRGGTYELSETLVFGPEDSPAHGAAVCYSSAPGERAVLSAGTGIKPWRRIDPAARPEGLPESAVSQVWYADLPRRSGEPVAIRALFDADGLLERAHSERLQSEKEPQEPVAPQVPPGVDPEEFLASHPVFREIRFAAGDMREWPNLRDVELFLTPRNPWTVNFLEIESVDEASGVARTNLPATYPITTAYGPSHIQRFYRVENVFEFLDRPGRWVTDTAAGRVYLWPRGVQDGDPPEGVVAPLLTELVRFEGDRARERYTHGIELSRITLCHGDRYSFRPGRRSVQHDWEEEDAPSALVRLREVERIRISECRILHSGGSAVRLDLHATDNELLHNEIGHVGGVGVSLVGYGPGTRDENHHNHIIGNHIHHVGRLWWHAAGIFVCQSGHNVIRDNLIHHTPYCAVVVSGARRSVFDDTAHRLREGALTIRADEVGDSPLEQPVLLGFRHARFNRIEHNEVHDAMELLGDGNGIYVSGTGVGNIISRNYVHDVSGEGTVSAIRLDDEQFHTLVTENVVLRICGAGIISKNINQVENNIIVDCYGPRQYGYLSARHRGPCYGTGMRRNILLRLPRERKEPFWVVGDSIGFLHQVSIDDNLIWDADDPESARSAVALLTDVGKGGRTVVGDPGFRDPAAADFRLPADSPAYAVGFRPFEYWGLTTIPGPPAP